MLRGMDRIPLSPHFWLHEFTRSEAAARRGRNIEVEPGSGVHRNLEHLCRTVLEPLRAALGGKPIAITSGYRPPWLNRLIGGAANSQHTQGLAADLIVPGLTPLEVCRLAVEARVPYDQLIHEFGQWTHISASPAVQPRGEVLTAKAINGATAYLHGLEEVA
jgi:hypothetical protein